MSGPTEHGTVSTYTNWKCHCDDCCAANTRAHLRYVRRIRRTPLPDGDRRHGTLNGYTNYGCRCAPCKAFKAAYERAYHGRG